MGKKGRDGFRSPVEAPDTLRTRQTAYILDLISEGPIGGLIGGYKGIALNETPVQHEGGGMNFQGIAYESRRGFADPDPFTLQTGAGRTVPVDQEVTELLPKGKGPDHGGLTRQINDKDVTHVVVTLGVNGLYRQITDDQERMGDTVRAEVRYRITVKDSAGRVVKTLDGKKHDKAMSRAEWSHCIKLTGAAPWTVTVEKTSPDSEKSNVKTDLFWATYTERKAYNLRYPFSATILLRADANTLGGRIPQRNYRVRGLEVAVPSNYDPETAEYKGIWDGTFKRAVSDNPAWVFYDLITNDRYGLARWLSSSTDLGNLADKWQLYSIARFCDELVSDGKGGKVRRYRFNGQIMGEGSARQVVQALASTFHGLACWNTGQVFARADRPSKPVKLLNQTNVIDGRFNYATGSYSERHTEAIVTYNDQSNYGKPAVEHVLNPLSRPTDPYRVLKITAYGCGDAGQAYRHGLWALLSESEALTCTCEVGPDCFDLLPGDTVAVADPMMAGGRWGGRVLEVSGNVLTLDAPLPAQALTLAVPLAKGGVGEYTVASADGAKVTLAAKPGPMLRLCPFVATGKTVGPKLFTVQSLKEKDTGRFELDLREVNPKKFELLDMGGPAILPKPWRDNSPRALPIPEGLRVVESTYLSGGTAQNRITLSWNAPREAVAGFDVQVAFPNGSIDRLTTDAYSADIPAAAVGPYEFKVCCRSADGRRGEWATLEYTAKGHSAKPKAPVNLKAKGGLRSLTVSWDMDADPLVGYYAVYIGETERKEDARDVGHVLASSFTVGGLGVLKTYWCWVAAYDLTGEVASDFVGPVSAVTDALKQEDIPEAVITESKLAGELIKKMGTDETARQKYEEVKQELSRVKTEAGKTAAEVAKEATAGLTADLAAEAKARQTLDAKLGGQFAKVEQVFKTQIGAAGLDDAAKKATALYTLKLDANGRVAGFGLASSADKGSEFAVVADRFTVATGNVKKPVFSVQKNTITLNGDLIADGSITGEKINARSRINIGDGGELVIGERGKVQIGKSLFFGTDGEVRIETRAGNGDKDDYSVLTAGDLKTYKHIGGAYREIKSLTRVASGTAKSGQKMTLPGVWATMPDVLLSPLSLPCFDPKWAGQRQALNLKVENASFNAATGRVSFTPRATLSLISNNVLMEAGDKEIAGNSIPTADTILCDVPVQLLPAGTSKVRVVLSGAAWLADRRDKTIFEPGKSYETSYIRYELGIEDLNRIKQSAYFCPLSFFLFVGEEPYELGGRKAPLTEKQTRAVMNIDKTVTLKAPLKTATDCKLRMVVRKEANRWYKIGAPAYRYKYKERSWSETHYRPKPDNSERPDYVTVTYHYTDIVSRTDIYSEVWLRPKSVTAIFKEGSQNITGTVSYIAVG